jgi:hypothetical protein
VKRNEEKGRNFLGQIIIKRKKENDELSIIWMYIGTSKLLYKVLEHLW